MTGVAVRCICWLGVMGLSGYAFLWNKPRIALGARNRIESSVRTMLRAKLHDLPKLRAWTNLPTMLAGKMNSLTPRIPATIHEKP